MSEGVAATQSMRQRVLTALIALPVALAVIAYLPIWPLALLGLGLSWIGMQEWRRLVGDPFPFPILTMAVVVTVLIALPLLGLGSPAISPGTSLIMTLVLGGLFAIGVTVTWLWLEGTGPIRNVQLLGRLWIEAPIIALFFLHDHHDNWIGFSFNPVLICLLPLWAGDTAGLFAGRAWGKRLLAPSISPKKTVEGGLANLAACLAVAGALGTAMGLEPWRWISVGLVCGILGQAGDLFESAIKRKADTKDSGTLLPGHGGVLDRLDSTLMTAIPNAIILLIKV
jgi:phosphatidate cytidylyltransferase